jgi:heme-degrading monooxygenase HmoA
MPNRETRRLTMVIALFKFRLRPDIDMAEWEQTFVRMVGLASEMPGFVSVEPYAAEDGSGLAVVRFESEAALQAWKTQPDHVVTQGRGREAFFDSYHMTVATSIIREYDFHREKSAEAAVA